MGDVTKLLENASTHGKTYVLPTKVAAKIEADLRTVLKAVEHGNAMPSYRDLVGYFQSSYKVPASRYLVAKWLRLVKSGKRVQ